MMHTHTHTHTLSLSLSFALSLFLQVLAKLLTKTPQHVRIIYCPSKTENPSATTNAISLIGAFLILHFRVSVDEAWAPFSHLELKPHTSARSRILAYRDATWTAVGKTFQLHLTACWRALQKAIEARYPRVSVCA